MGKILRTPFENSAKSRLQAVQIRKHKSWNLVAWHHRLLFHRWGWGRGKRAKVGLQFYVSSTSQKQTEDWRPIEILKIWTPPVYLFFLWCIRIACWHMLVWLGPPFVVRPCLNHYLYRLDCDSITILNFTSLNLNYSTIIYLIGYN